MEILKLIIIIISVLLGPHLILRKYEWFIKFEMYLLAKYPNQSERIMKFFGIRFWYCSACTSFWISVLLFNLLNIDDYVLHSFVVYLMSKEQYEES